ncbi:MAG: cyclodeaminase/cyclohydrolase family protein [Gammaproteobacteria bacterium]|nr:cyclodeaminase/cyclohydrolase family protein [Gammaproteobacteria bacterium]
MRPSDSLGEYFESLAARSPTPGGGAVASLNGAQGCALMAMVGRFTKGNALNSLVARADTARERCLALATEDASCFADVMAAWKLPAGERDQPLQQALERAAEVPLTLIDTLQALTGDIETLESTGNPNLATDTGIAAQQFVAAIEAARLNVLVNIRDITDDTFKGSARTRLDAASEHERRLTAVAQRITQNLKP